MSEPPNFGLEGPPWTGPRVGGGPVHSLFPSTITKPRSHGARVYAGSIAYPCVEDEPRRRDSRGRGLGWKPRDPRPLPSPFGREHTGIVLVSLVRKVPAYRRVPRSSLALSADARSGRRTAASLPPAPPSARSQDHATPCAGPCGTAFQLGSILFS